MTILKKIEGIRLIQYFYYTEQRLEDSVNSSDYRFLRKELDSVDLLEEIIAKENLKLFRQVEYDILKILGLYNEEIK